MVTFLGPDAVVELVVDPESGPQAASTAALRAGSVSSTPRRENSAPGRATSVEGSRSIVTGLLRLCRASSTTSALGQEETPSLPPGVGLPQRCCGLDQVQLRNH